MSEVAGTIDGMNQLSGLWVCACDDAATHLIFCYHCDHADGRCTRCTDDNSDVAALGCGHLVLTPYAGVCAL